MLFIGNLLFIILGSLISKSIFIFLIRYSNFRRRIYVDVKERQNTFMVQITKSSNFINIKILTDNEIFSLHFAEREIY